MSKILKKALYRAGRYCDELGISGLLSEDRESFDTYVEPTLFESYVKYLSSLTESMNIKYVYNNLALPFVQSQSNQDIPENSVGLQDLNRLFRDSLSSKRHSQKEEKPIVVCFEGLYFNGIYVQDLISDVPLVVTRILFKKRGQDESGLTCPFENCEFEFPWRTVGAARKSPKQYTESVKNLGQDHFRDVHSKDSVFTSSDAWEFFEMPSLRPDFANVQKLKLEINSEEFRDGFEMFDCDSSELDEETIMMINLAVDSAGIAP
jgi:hypothetical protein